MRELDHEQALLALGLTVEQKICIEGKISRAINLPFPRPSPSSHWRAATTIKNGSMEMEKSPTTSPHTLSTSPSWETPSTSRFPRPRPPGMTNIRCLAMHEIPQVANPPAFSLQ